MVARLLQPVADLRGAVDKVLAQEGPGGQRFRNATFGLEGIALVKKCSQFIRSADAIDAQIKAIKKGASSLLTIEDYVANWGSLWDFEPAYVDMAKINVKEYDKAAGDQRYEPGPIKRNRNESI